MLDTVTYEYSIKLHVRKQNNCNVYYGVYGFNIDYNVIEGSEIANVNVLHENGVVELNNYRRNYYHSTASVP